MQSMFSIESVFIFCFENIEIGVSTLASQLLQNVIDEKCEAGPKSFAFCIMQSPHPQSSVSGKLTQYVKILRSEKQIEISIFIWISD